MKSCKNNLNPIKLLILLILLLVSNESFSQFSINEDSLELSCNAKNKTKKGKKILRGLANASLGLPQTEEPTYEESPYNIRENAETSIIQIASIYGQYDKAIRNYKYISDRITLDGDSFIIKLIVRNAKIIKNLKRLNSEQLETSENKTILCVLSTENQIIAKELSQFSVKFQPIYLEALKIERERLEKEEREKELKKQERQKQIQKETEQFIQEHVEWRKVAKHSFKIDYTKEYVTKECRFCYHECVIETTIFTAPDFKKFSEKEQKHLNLAYSAFLKSNESKLGSHDGCHTYGCKESNSGQHTWKTIKTDEKTSSIFFNVGK